MSDQEDITKRMDADEGITKGMDPAHVMPAAPAGGDLRTGAGLPIGESVVGRYRVVEGPLGSRTGEADVYRCLDAETGDAVAVKYYRSAVQPKEEVLKRLRGLKHKDIVQLREVGEWQGRFYEVMEFCAGGTLADMGAALAEDKLRPLLRDAVSGLRYLHTSGIVHRDIKPTNLFFRDRDRHDLVIGDFGISSIVSEGVRLDTTATIDRMTFEYAAPEQLGDKKFGPKTDYYSLGITLLFALHGRSPFDGMDEYKIMELKSRSELPIPTTCSEELCNLLRGLTRRNVQYRWGYPQVQAWLDGQAVTTDEGLPDSVALNHADRSAPYPAYPKVTNPVEMAANLQKFRAEYELFHGFISRWAHLHFSADLANRIVEIEENYTKNPKLGVFKLRYLLDPRLPLDVGGEFVGGLKGLANLIEGALRKNDRAKLSLCEDLMYDRKFESWIEAAFPPDVGGKAAKAALEMRTKHQNKRLGLMAFFYMLNPQAPLYISSTAALTAPSQLEAVLKAHPEARAAFEELIFEGVLGEWLRIAFPALIEEARIVDWCAEVLKNRRDLGVEMVRWRFDPKLPLVRYGITGKDPDSLARAIGANDDTFRNGMLLLEEGWIRAWLVATGRLERLEARNALDEIVSSRASWGAKLQAVLGKLSPYAAKPVPTAQPASLSFGHLPPSGSRRAKVVVRNGGGGFLSGSISIDQEDPAVKLEGQTRIDGTAVEFAVTVSSIGQPAGTRRKMNIRVVTNGGNLDVPVTYTVGAPWGAMLGRSLLVGLIWAVFFGFVRALVGWGFPAFHSARLAWMGKNQLIPPGYGLTISFIFQCVMLLIPVCLLVGAIYGYGYYLWRMRENKMGAEPGLWRRLMGRR